MAQTWYYVLEGERQGPVELTELKQLVQNSVLNQEDYVWTKGYENWVRVGDVDELNIQDQIVVDEAPEEISMPGVIGEEQFITLDLSTHNPNVKDLYIKVGADRGGNEVEYGPFSVGILKKLFNENRISAKTFIFAKGMKEWMILADVQGYESVFEEMPPIIEEKDKRAFKRKPLVARMFIQSENQVFEGICRDLSIGGMQVLIDNFPGDVGGRITINVHPDNEEHHFVASGEIVRRLEGGQGFSFRFIDLEKSAINSINSYLG